ncbi:putative sulfate exporter family transporter [Opitutus sp. ER46]|uniref:YeiH family protein n=1 Tax=Opitutus sp. ER46 TaxID=2161864 RepID=UPI000D3119AE|nr:putative sulfate exporter family transporter [Opitutus sp. ER46]PTX91483.1 putative sulfate exporter family transporter [Opitutus sp. ER46]
MNGRQRLAAALLIVGGLLALLPWTPPWAALLAGAALALTLGNPIAQRTGVAAKHLLQFAVMGLGAGVNLTIVARVGSQGLLYTLVGLLATFAFGAWLTTRFGIAPKVGALISAGTGICGGSAIAAAAPAVGARPEETSAALAVVFLLNGVALLVFPLAGTWIGFDPHQYGLWCALAIHDTSSVTGAALTHGREALMVATTVKLARALWIVPVALVLGMWARRRDPETSHGGRLPIPWFIGGFVLLSAVFTFVPSLAPLAPWVTAGARALLTLTLFFIGAGLTREVIRLLGLRPLAHAVTLWIVVAAATAGAIHAGLIH